MESLLSSPVAWELFGIFPPYQLVLIALLIVLIIVFFKLRNRQQ